MDRRIFLKNITVIGGISATAGFALTGISGKKNRYFRPPGALPEDDFLAACIRCGKCVQSCPYNSLVTGNILDGMSIGAPYFEFREKPCYMCENIPCIESCPTDALDHSLGNINNSKIGTACITDRESCLSLNGIGCEICYRVCPLIDKAIKIEKHENKITKKHTVFEPVIQKDYCTGCGICVHSCPLDDSAINIVPVQLKSKSSHYKLLKES